MGKIFGPITALLLGAAILLVGGGIQGLLIPVRAGLEGFAPQLIGLLSSGYSIGFVLGCLLAPHIVQRVGHIRTFAVLAAIASSLAIIFALAVNPITWIGLRIWSGFCFSGLFMVIESWLNERSTNENRGQIFSAYMIINFAATTCGQMMLPLAQPLEFTLFAMTGVAIAWALIPVGLTKSVAPNPIAQVRLRLRRLYRTSPVGVVGAFAVGVANGSFGGLGAIYGQRLGLSTTGVALFMSAAVVGGALSQYPVGRLSDRIDRRYVILGSGLAASAMAGVLIAAAVTGWLGDGAINWPLIALGLVFGACAYPLYGLCVAHTNDFVDRSGFVEASSGLLLTWGLGATLGPPLAATAMQAMGAGGLFAFTACVHCLLAVFAGYRMTRRAALPPEAREDFVAFGVIRSTPEAMGLDPRAPDSNADPEP